MKKKISQHIHNEEKSGAAPEKNQPSGTGPDVLTRW